MGESRVLNDKSDELISQPELDISKSHYNELSEPCQKTKINEYKKTGVAYSPKTHSGTFITLDDLSRAIKNRVGKIKIKEARRDAGFVLDIFGFQDRVIDNVLDPEDRQLFYILEEEGMLTTEREETTLYDGREWRTHYWVFRKDVILRYANDENCVKFPLSIKDNTFTGYEKFWKEQEEESKKNDYSADFAGLTKGKQA